MDEIFSELILELSGLRFSTHHSTETVKQFPFIVTNYDSSIVSRSIMSNFGFFKNVRFGLCSTLPDIVRFCLTFPDIV